MRPMNATPPRDSLVGRVYSAANFSGLLLLYGLKNPKEVAQALFQRHQNLSTPPTIKGILSTLSVAARMDCSAASKTCMGGSRIRTVPVAASAAVPVKSLSGVQVTWASQVWSGIELRQNPAAHLYVAGAISVYHPQLGHCLLLVLCEIQACSCSGIGSTFAFCGLSKLRPSFRVWLPWLQCANIPQTVPRTHPQSPRYC